MHWEPTHVNPMLTLRTAACSARWDEGWHDLLAVPNWLQKNDAHPLLASELINSTGKAILLIKQRRKKEKMMRWL
ncbi:MAG: hypothetical protein JO031_04305 [Ktedonobacteraceae bacterium]|nr:hypothetical protein [Ktedonobacteraceae bacterium]